MFNESHDATLGIIGGIGFIILLFTIFLSSMPLFVENLYGLASINLAAVLLGTFGGFGAIVSLILSPAIRCYTRISIYIAFVSIAAILLVVQKTIERTNSNKHSCISMLIASITLLCIGLYDQTMPNVIKYSANKVEFENDHHFIYQVERSVSAGTMIYQLPYIGYPEVAPVYQEGSYGLARGYLHSHNLKWSYGGMRGREGDLWLRTLSQFPIEEQITIIRQSGFGGIYVERRAFKDYAVALERSVRKLLDQDPLVSENGHLAFYRVEPTGHGPASIAFPIAELGQGFYDWEEDPREGRWSWSKGNAELVVCNYAKTATQAQLSFTLQTLLPRQVEIQKEPNSQPLVYQLEAHQQVPVQFDMNLNPGKNIITFKTDKPGQPPGTDDTRKITFGVLNVRASALY